MAYRQSLRAWLETSRFSFCSALREVKVTSPAVAYFSKDIGSGEDGEMRLGSESPAPFRCFKILLRSKYLRL